MAKERVKDKGGLGNGKSKAANNNRDINGKKNNSESSSNNALKNTGHRDIE